MFNPPTAPYGLGFLRSFETAAQSFAVKPIGALIHDPSEIEGTMSVLGSGADGGLIVLPDAFTDVYRELIIALAARYRVPTIYSYRYFTAAGGLISYGVNSADIYRRAAARPSGASAFSLSTTAVPISPTRSPFSSDSSPPPFP